MDTKREKSWHLTPHLTTEGIHADLLAYFNITLHVQEQSQLAHRAHSDCAGSAFNKRSYEIPWSLFAHKRACNTPLQKAWHQKSRPLESHNDPQNSRIATWICNCSALPSQQVPKWKGHAGTAVICFLLGDAGSSCFPISLSGVGFPQQHALFPHWDETALLFSQSV